MHAAAFGLSWTHGHLPAPTRAPESPPSPAALAGETLEVEPPPLSSEPVDLDEGAVASPSPREGSPAAPTPPTARAPGDEPRASRAAARGAAAAPAPAPALFGAVGVRFATDLATTFTRGFPQAASADPVWSTAAVGSAGTADVTLTLDESGHLVSSAVSGSPSPALRRGIERTLVLLGTRTFTARAALTRLRVTARITRDEVHDGLHGDVFALSGGSFAGTVGQAFFTLPPASGAGRRIDLELRLLP